MTELENRIKRLEGWMPPREQPPVTVLVKGDPQPEGFEGYDDPVITIVSARGKELTERIIAGERPVQLK